MRLVEVVIVAALPAEGGAAGALQAAEVDVPACQQLQVLLGEIIADDAHQPHPVEEAGRIGKINRRAAERLLGRAEGSLDGIERDGTDY